MKKSWAALAALIAVTAVTAASAQAPETPRLNYAAHRKLGWRLTCQAWTFREMSAFETLDTIRGLGVRFVQFYPGQKFSKEKPDAKLDHHMSPELIAELKAKLEANRIRPVCYGVVGVGSDEASARKVFEWAKTMGIATIVSEPPEETVPMLDKLAQEYRIKVAIHDHPKPSHYWNPDTVLKVCQGRSDHIGACADTGHWFRSDLNPVECLKKLEGKIIDMHFKDLGAEKHDVPWGTGLSNARGILEEIKRQGAKPTISIEYEHGRGPELLANVKKCVEWFDKTATELAQ